MRLSCEEFLRRFLQHLLPRGFPRIRYFWLDGQPYTRKDAPTLPPPAPSAVAGNGCSVAQPACYLAMSSLPGAHVRHRAAYPSTDLLCRSPTCAMTHPDCTLNPALASCLSPCSLNLCSTPRYRPSEHANQPHSIPPVPARCALWIHPDHYLPRFPMASLLITTIENP
jgi:hypothetical protein